jgi:hypothetical protein
VADCDGGEMNTDGPRKQLEILSKCHLAKREHRNIVEYWSDAIDFLSIGVYPGARLILRRLTHQYRNQIRAIKRNQERAG